jgi:RHS repeat-associated protein
VRTFGYTYDAANNLTAKTRLVTSPASYDSWVYGYDNANEQTSVTLNGGTPETRTYDAWGRMATRTQGALSGTYGYRYGGRLYSYAGNFGGEAPETMQYRGDGRLYSRVSGTATKVYRYDRGWNAINEEDGAGNLTASSVYAPTSEVGERLAWVSGAMGSGTWNYAYHDQLGSTRRWRSATKALLGSNDCGPYGEKYTSYSGAPFDYALHVQDPYTLLYHAPYREYATGWARWTTRDPLNMVDGPNMYGYVGDSPLKGIDPLGLLENECSAIGDMAVSACMSVAIAALLAGVADIAVISRCAWVCIGTGGIGCTACIVAAVSTIVITAIIEACADAACKCLLTQYNQCKQMQGSGGRGRDKI